jgi:hypothetical protein
LEFKNCYHFEHEKILHDVFSPHLSGNSRRCSDDSFLDRKIAGRFGEENNLVESRICRLWKRYSEEG